MRKDDGVDGDAQRIGQLTWLLFLKIFDQYEETWEDDAEDRRQKYKSPLPEECRWRNWTICFICAICGSECRQHDHLLRGLLQEVP